jgi:hypothetical protein
MSLPSLNRPSCEVGTLGNENLSGSNVDMAAGCEESAANIMGVSGKHRKRATDVTT